MEEYLKRDFYIGITGWVCDLKRGKELRECINQIPEDKLLIETDSPYLSPDPLRGKSNEPSHIIHTIKFLSNEILWKLRKFINSKTSWSFFYF